jgi:hypothetical protein
MAAIPAFARLMRTLPIKKEPAPFSSPTSIIKSSQVLWFVGSLVLGYGEQLLQPQGQPQTLEPQAPTDDRPQRVDILGLEV